MKQPVILSGYQDQDSFLSWCSYYEGHAWVCDGYKSFFSCDTGASYLYLHMNWSWNDSEKYRLLNGWYSFNNWNPGDDSYNHKREMIYNIKPQ
ncbi:C10 family peptidase [Flammeovirga aprica]|uniref:Uncharacterized protein n=1 Tax=Flammeovirga aprica JL-4 TaxID=694437 RepID=A0A7X9RS13_9BACT|nr:hypothetical protein [Flammeovirga aprica JL-4]